MANKSRFKYDETKFRPKQREAAVMLVEREFAPKEERKTMQQIADELGMSRMGLYKWDKHDANFIAYKNYLASEFMDSYLSYTYAKLIDVIGDGNTKGIELFLKRIGDLDTKSEISLTDNRGDESFEDRKAALLERLGQGEADSEEESES